LHILLREVPLKGGGRSEVQGCVLQIKTPFPIDVPELDAPIGGEGERV
jgi:hypothetical protein